MNHPLTRSRRGRAAFASLVAARRPLLFLDLDGTLAPFTDRPMDARVPAVARQAIARLRGTGARVVLVSGRAVGAVHHVARAPVDAILGDHGARYSVGTRVRALLPASATAFERAVERVRARLRGRRGLRLEVKERSIAVHFRHLGHAREHHEELSVAAILRQEGLRALVGHRVVDGQLHGVDKGHGVRKWLQREHRRGIDLVLYAGDDTTDEDAFVALRNRAITIAVGPRTRHAALRARDPLSFAAWLARVAEARSTQRRRGGTRHTRRQPGLVSPWPEGRAAGEAHPHDAAAGPDGLHLPPAVTSLEEATPGPAQVTRVRVARELVPLAPGHR